MSRKHATHLRWYERLRGKKCFHSRTVHRVLVVIYEVTSSRHKLTSCLLISSQRYSHRAIVRSSKKVNTVQLHETTGARTSTKITNPRYDDPVPHVRAATVSGCLFLIDMMSAVAHFSG